MSDNDYRPRPLGRPPLEGVEPESEESRLATLRVWVEPTLFEPYEGERRALLDRARPFMAAAGLLVHDQWVSAEPSEVRLYRKFAAGRVTLDHVEDLIANQPGVSFAVLIDRLYKEEPWTDGKKQAAAARARQSIHRLQHCGRIVRRSDSKGTPRFYLASATPRHEVLKDVPSSPDDVRALGWRLLHHVDREDGMVSFIFIRDGDVVEAIGHTDAETLDFIREELATRAST